MKENPLFTIWVDADSCPTPVRDLIIRFSLRLELTCIFVANRKISIPKHNPLFKMIICDVTPDAADNYIVENAKQDDIIITRDIPLAARLVEKKIQVINDRGILYDETNIRERLSLRNFNLQLFQSGLIPEKTETYGKKELNLFANCFDRELQKKIRTIKDRM